jgi:hypothetical protein
LLVVGIAVAEAVVAFAADQHVRARATGEVVVAFAADQHVRAGATGEVVFAGAFAHEDIVTRPAVDDRATASEPGVDRHRVVAVTEIGEPSVPAGQWAAHDHRLRLAAAAGLHRSGGVGDENVGTVGAPG